MLKTIISTFEFYQKYKKDDEMRQALYSNLKRELYFNLEIFDEIKKTKSENINELVSLLKTDFYDTIKNSLIDLKNIKEPKEIDFSEIIDDEKLTNKNFKRWIANIKTDIELIEKVYLKISVLKSLASIGIKKRDVSYQYVKFLMLILKRIIKQYKS